MYRAAAALALAAFPTAALAYVPPPYSITPIPSFTPHSVNHLASYPLGINASGRVVGYGYSATGVMEPLNWKDGVLRDMTGPTFGRTFSSGVNNAGRVAGAGYVLDPSGQIVESHALKWTGGIATDLGTLGGHHAVALAINNANDQIVGYSTLPGETVTKAFSFANGHMTPLETLPGATEAYPYAISDNRYVVGAAVVNGTAKPFRVRDGAASELSIPATSRTGAANGVNNIGAAVGTYEIDLMTGAHAGVLWRVSGERVDLGNLGGPLAYAVARDINNGGLVVGTSLAADGEFSAFLWKSGQMYDLNDWVVDGAGVRLLSANSINDEGQIAAAALINGVQTTVILNPVVAIPAPGALALLAGAGCVAFRRRR